MTLVLLIVKGHLYSLSAISELVEFERARRGLTHHPVDVRKISTCCINMYLQLLA